MSATANTAIQAFDQRDNEKAHRIKLVCAYGVAITLLCTLAVYGFNYYALAAADRPFSPKHALLKPSGVIGLRLGFLGFAMFVVIFLYPLRKSWKWLLQKGNSRHWLDFHVLLGLAAPFVIAFHSAFKFRGFAGMAFWIMVAVSVSGVIGRYLYGQIPRNLKAAEHSLKELQERQMALSRNLAAKKLLPESGLRELLRLPSVRMVQQMFMPIALAYMMALDVMRPFRVAAIRRHALGWGACFTTFGGFLPSRHSSLEQVLRTARQEASLAKRILFLSRSQQVFHLWHVVHKPFSYTFALLALIHIAVVSMMGYF